MLFYVVHQVLDFQRGPCRIRVAVTCLTVGLLKVCGRGILYIRKQAPHYLEQFAFPGEAVYNLMQ